MQRVAGQPDDTEEARIPLLCALLGPVERRALGIGVDDENALSFPGPLAGEMQCQRRLAEAALLVEKRHDHRGGLVVVHRSRRSPATEELDSLTLESKLGGPEVTAPLEEKRG